MKIGDFVHGTWYVDSEPHQGKYCPYAVDIKCKNCGRIKEESEYCLLSMPHLCGGECVCRYIGQKFNNLTISAVYKTPYSCKVDALCDCGNLVKNVYINALLKNKKTSCGCVSGKYIDLKDYTGQKFNKLTAISRIKGNLWLFKCDCGKERRDSIITVKNAPIKSCGCLSSYKKTYDNIAIKYNKLTIISKPKIKKLRTVVDVKCDCGKTKKDVVLSSIINNKIKSCRCLIYKREDFTNKTLNYLTGIKYIKNDLKQGQTWLWKCECGQKIKLRTSDVKGERRISCGCHLKKIRLDKSLKRKKEKQELKIKLKQEKCLQLINSRIGLKINNWTIKSHIRDNIYQIECVCGKTIETRYNNIRANKSCSCMRKKIVKIEPSYEISDTYFSTTKKSAHKRDIDFNLTIEEVNEVYKKQNKKCKLSGVDLIFVTPYNYNLQTASIDRIDSDKGYFKENIQITHKWVNVMKKCMSNKQLIDYCNKVLQYQEDGLITNITYPDYSKLLPKRGMFHPDWKGYYEIPIHWWNRLKRNSNRREINLNIELKDIWSLFIKQKRICYLSGLSLFWGTGNKDRTASLDRIDSNKDYTIDNIAIVHKDINMMKMDMSNEEFIGWCKLISDYNKTE